MTDKRKTLNLIPINGHLSSVMSKTLHRVRVIASKHIDAKFAAKTSGCGDSLKLKVTSTSYVMKSRDE
ncbi:unnamed protein product [Sphenostylis stenocarpa]|uniref:Uncharacterized protein n=1 Tax=Sphenostylis stenocarpa TaxID=92480 RepID=A0AA86SEE8_9FABA|nr:unnamed protein product [Sphenostylis stenocarpa]